MSDYDTDIMVWSEQQAGLLRRRAAGELVNEAELDWLNIAEEIESLGKAAVRELANRVSTILIHLMKLQASPAIDPRIGWFETVREQRDELERLLKDAPSLRRTVPAVINGVVQIRVTPKTRNSFAIRASSISGVTQKWHFLNHAGVGVQAARHGGVDDLVGAVGGLNCSPD